MEDYQPRRTTGTTVHSHHIPERVHIDSTVLLIETIERLGTWNEVA